MQRRAVAVYTVLFVLVAGVAGVLTVTAESPEIAFDNPDFEVSEGDLVEVGDETYTVAGIGEEDSMPVGTLEREVTAEFSETWANGSTVTVDEREWTVEISGDDPSAFTLVEVLDRQAILEGDDAADNETIERDDGEYVAVTEDGETTLVPVDEYFPASEERSYAAGDSLEYEGQSATVDEVTADQVAVVWEGTQTDSIEVEQEATVTIGGTEFIAHFPDASTMTLSSDIEGYEAQVAEIGQFEQYNSGLTRVAILALFSITLLLSAAFIPSRY